MRICFACCWFCSISVCIITNTTLIIPPVSRHCSDTKTEFKKRTNIESDSEKKKGSTFIWDMISYSWFFDIPAMLSGRPAPETCFPAMLHVPTSTGSEDLVPSQFLANKGARLVRMLLMLWAQFRNFFGVQRHKIAAIFNKQTFANCKAFGQNLIQMYLINHN